MMNECHVLWMKMDVHGWIWSMKKVVDGWISSINGELNYMNYHMKTLYLSYNWFQIFECCIIYVGLLDVIHDKHQFIGMNEDGPKNITTSMNNIPLWNNIGLTKNCVINGLCM
jgi:hypothetical protein